MKGRSIGPLSESLKWTHVVVSKWETHHAKEEWKTRNKQLKEGGQKPPDEKLEELFDCVMDLESCNVLISRRMNREKVTNVTLNKNALSKQR